MLLFRRNGVDVFFRKYLWILDLSVVGLCAAILALAGSSLVEMRFPKAPVLLPRPAARSVPAPIAASKRPDAILKRNIFCSACPPILLDGEQKPAEAAEQGPSEPQATSLPLRLVAVMFAPEAERHRWSTAIIHDDDSKTFGAFGVGAEVHGALLLSIQETRVYLDNAGVQEYLDLLTPGKPAPAPPPPPPPAARPPPAAKTATADKAFLAELDRGIKKLGDRRYEVERRALDSVVNNIALLSRSARIIPEVRNGKPSGFRLFAVRPNGPFAKIGLQSGDSIVSINGLDMSSPQKALEVYAKLKSASHVTLGLERAGKKVAQEYTIR